MTINIHENGCTFCNECNGRKELSYFERVFAKKYGIQDRTAWDTSCFRVVPTLGSFVPGYLLVIPREHALSFLSLTSSHLSELDDLEKELSAFIRTMYHKGYIIFEHGSSDESNVGGMSVVHAHIHVIPCDTAIMPHSKAYTFRSFNSFHEAAAYYAANQSGAPYLLCKDTDGKVYLSFAENIPSQYFRNLVCDLIAEKGTGNWKAYPYVDHIKQTLADVERYRRNIKENNSYGTYDTE